MDTFFQPDLGGISVQVGAVAGKVYGIHSVNRMGNI
jgi:hypothetical protein